MIRKELIFVDVNLSDRDSVLKRITKRAYKIGVINNINNYIEAVYKREEEISTSVGYGIAIPHGKSSAVTQSFIAYLRTKEPFLWDKRNGEYVSSVFMIGVPLVEGNLTHLKLLSQISRNLMHESFRKKLNDCKTSEDAYQLLKIIDEEINEKGDGL